MLSQLLSALLAGGVLSLSLVPLDPRWPSPGPAGLLAVVWVIALLWALALPLIVPARWPASWAAAALTAAAAGLPPLLIGARLTSANPRSLALLAAWPAAAWLAASGVLAVLERWTAHARAHAQAALLGLCVLPPALDFARLEYLHDARWLPGFSPLERLLTADGHAALPWSTLTLPAVWAVVGGAALLIARPWREAAA